MEQIFDKVDQYISHLFGMRDDVLITIEQSIRDAGIQDISISPNQGKFLQVLARLNKAVKILEIGTFFGYSSVWLARALPENGRLITIESNPDFAAIAKNNFINAGLDHKIQVRTGSALDILPIIAEEGIAPFDMIFIDADKPPYATYFQWALRFSRPGTLIVADNVIRHLFDPNTPTEKREGVEHFNQLLAGSDAVVATIIQSVGVKEHDGMAVAVVK